MLHAYYGDDIEPPAVIRSALDRAGIEYRELDEDSLIVEVANLLADCQVVGWHQG